MGGPPDTGPARNPVQSRKSTTSYLERYTLLAVTGLATEDDDGNGGPRMDEGSTASYLQVIKTAQDVESLRKVYEAAKKAATDAKDDVAFKLFGETKNNRYKELARAKSI
jgi:hypothetical protein